MLERIGALYKLEDHCKRHNLEGEEKREHRLTYSKPIIDGIVEHVQGQLRTRAFLPSPPYNKALGYLNNRVIDLRVFLECPDVPLDTNHVERALRVMPMGRKNWLFSWTELGAQ